jgi:hypothetical protein
VSSRHCEAQLNGNELSVRDLDSTNGTFINGAKIHQGTLRLGQILRLGQVEMRLQVFVPPVASEIGSLITRAVIAPKPMRNTATSLPDLIQIECVLRHSSIVEVRHRDVRGLIYIENGALIHVVAFRADIGTVVGEKALVRLLSLTGSEFNVLGFKVPSTRTLQGHWESVLREAARQRDETAIILLDDTKTSATKAAREAAPR